MNAVLTMGTSRMSSDIKWHAVNHLQQLPQFACLLSPDQGPLPLNEADRRVIVFARKIGGATVALAALTDAACEGVRVSLKRARHAGIEIAEHYLLDVDVFEVMAQQACGGVVTSVARHAPNDADELFGPIFARCDALGATDIHFEGNANGAVVKARVHGEILTAPIQQLTKDEHEKLARALYLKGGEGVQAHEWNRDHYLGTSFTAGLSDREFRIRFSQRNAYPDTFDFSLRILQIGAAAAPRSFVALGYTDWQAAALENALRHPRGMSLFVGEMNSGKSTTLASVLHWILKTYPGRRIQTLEDPVEYLIPGVRQSSVSERASKGDGKKLWESALGGLMRSDANDIMLGEIRDELSAQYAQELTSTGHRFLSTLHCDTPIRALQRLVKHGADPAVIFSSGFVNVIVHQYLLQRLCPHCAIPLAAAPHVPRHVLDGLRSAAPEPIEATMLRVRVRGPGCAECAGRGIVGRTVAAEMLFPDRELNRMMLAQNYDEAHDSWLRGVCGQAAGRRFTSILMHGLHKVFNGEVCPMDVDCHIGPIVRGLDRLPPDMPRELELEAA